jgi:hypothetical protein
VKVADQWFDYVRHRLTVFDDPLFRINPEEHRYFYGEHELTAVSSWIKARTHEFDAEYWAARKAEERKCSPADVLAEWEATARESTVLGHAVHDGIERVFTGEDPGEVIRSLAHLPEAQARLTAWWRGWGVHFAGFRVVACERKIFSLRWGLSGTLDALLEKDGRFWIADWKTNKRIRTNQDFSFERFRPPFHFLEGNELNKYSMQVGLYRLMLAEVGIPTEGAVIVHLPKGKEAEIKMAHDYTHLLYRYLTTGLV